MHRRDFWRRIGAAGMAAVVATAGAAAPHVAPTEKVSVAMMGVNGRGRVLTSLFAALPDVEIPYICEVDGNVAGPACDIVEKAKNKTPRLVEDLRTVLDDNSVDAVVDRHAGPLARSGHDSGLRSG